MLSPWSSSLSLFLPILIRSGHNFIVSIYRSNCESHRVVSRPVASSSFLKQQRDKCPCIGPLVASCHSLSNLTVPHFVLLLHSELLPQTFWYSTTVVSPFKYKFPPIASIYLRPPDYRIWHNLIQCNHRFHVHSVHTRTSIAYSSICS